MTTAGGPKTWGCYSCLSGRPGAGIPVCGLVQIPITAVLIGVFPAHSHAPGDSQPAHGQPPLPRDQVPGAGTDSSMHMRT